MVSVEYDINRGWCKVSGEWPNVRFTKEIDRGASIKKSTSVVRGSSDIQTACSALDTEITKLVNIIAQQRELLKNTKKDMFKRSCTWRCIFLVVDPCCSEKRKEKIFSFNPLYKEISSAINFLDRIKREVGDQKEAIEARA